MKKSVLTFLLSVNFMLPLAYADSENIEEMCKLEATSNDIPEADMAQYIQECVEETKRIRSDLEATEKSSEQGSESN